MVSQGESRGEPQAKTGFPKEVFRRDDSEASAKQGQKNLKLGDELERTKLGGGSKNPKATK